MGTPFLLTLTLPPFRDLPLPREGVPQAEQLAQSLWQIPSAPTLASAKIRNPQSAIRNPQ